MPRQDFVSGNFATKNCNEELVTTREIFGNIAAPLLTTFGGVEDVAP